MKSDLVLDATKFAPTAISKETQLFNDELSALNESYPAFSPTRVGDYRAQAMRGEIAMPRSAILPQAKSITIPSREPGRDIPCRLFFPEGEGTAVEGVFLHIHGGGYVLGSEKVSDTLLQLYANAKSYAVVSVGYRLAPEHPFPAGPQDCYDVSEHLVRKGKDEYGAELKMIGGDSVGANLSVLTALHLLRTFPALSLAGLVLLFGGFSHGVVPSGTTKKGVSLLSQSFWKDLLSCYLPAGSNNGAEALHLYSPEVAPFYADLEEFRGRLPKALFLAGTADVLMDDSVMMCVRWQQAGAEGILRVVPGGAHCFTGLPVEKYPAAKEGLEVVQEFLDETD
ncbi:hypothetical protein VTN00DRAFT_5768 [Thermoascus crustaceus]|uniref:uncharacterized protein n=1 Tax=Thermoascus crustaceus TaxID=5088 RepID=UPI003743F8E0